MQTDERRYTRAGSAVAQSLDEQGVALDLVSGHFYRMNATSMAIWNAIGDGASVQEVAGRMASAHEGDAQTIEADVRQHLGELERLGLVEAR